MATTHDVSGYLHASRRKRLPYTVHIGARPRKRFSGFFEILDKQRAIRQNTFKNRFETLPVELLEIIFNYLTIKDLFQASAVCKDWSTITWTSQTKLNFSPLWSQLTSEKVIRLLSKTNPNKLTCVNLYHCLNITDPVVDYLIAERPYISKLVLTLCDQISPSALARIGNFKKLASLDVSFCQTVTDEPLKSWANLQCLERLFMSHCRSITNDGIRSLKELPKLKQFHLSSSHQLITDEGVELIAAQFPNLEILDLSYCKKVTDAGIKHLAQLKNLKTLDVSCCPSVSDESISVLVGLKNLEKLNMQGTSASPDLIVSKMTQVKRFDFASILLILANTN
jgi:Leucine-rich repeat (LRR) protein